MPVMGFETRQASANAPCNILCLRLLIGGSLAGSFSQQGMEGYGAIAQAKKYGVPMERVGQISAVMTTGTCIPSR